MEYDTDPLRYDVWIEDALRTVIKRTMSYVSENGLPGEHHFYITFRTTDDKVIMPDYLRADHPEEMTVVLQYQYDSLDVDDDAIYATLRFNGKPETMIIPLSSIVSFADPSVNFGLQLKVANLDDDADDLDPAEAQDLDADQSAEDTKKDGEQTTGEVITLDAFRKK